MLALVEEKPLKLSQNQACKAVIIAVGLGFLTMAIEVRYLHLNAVKESWAANVPTVASIVAMIASFVSLFVHGRAKKLASVFFAVVAIAGLAGVYFHTELKTERFTMLFSSSKKESESEQKSEEDKGKEEGRESEDEDSNVPPLAPLAMLGLAVIGLLANSVEEGASESDAATRDV